jgi:radical SAM superfamily enzyme YgiQ (UPF0313 family)
MKIGFIAMSGIRARARELEELGVTLPGFVERKKVVASLPSLGLLTLAALTPDDIELEYREVQDLPPAGELPGEYDLVAISTFSAQSLEAYELADRYRAAGAAVVMGGLHVTALPEEALQHCTAVAVGEGELTWPRMVEDFRRGELSGIYRPPPSEFFDLADAPVPRYDLLEPERYNRLTVQTTRGCPHRCSFCASSILLTPKYRCKPVAKVIEEVRAIKAVWDEPFIEFADDNSFVNKAHGKDLLRALKAERVKWFTEADLSIAEDPELLDLMRSSGCRQVLIGLESPTAAGLDGLETRANWKSRRQDRALRAVQAIQSRGITVNGCFILGLDGQDERVFEEVHDFVERSGLYEVQITLLTAFPGTPLLTQLRKEGRLLRDGAWDLCTLFDVNFVPTGMSPERLQRGFVELSRRLYDADAVTRRRKRFFRRLRASRRRVPAA